MTTADPTFWFEKALSVNDTPRRRGHQNALVIPIRAGRRLFPGMDVGRPVDVDVTGPDGRTWQLDVRYYAKGEYHLAGSDALLEAYGLEPGDTVRFHMLPGSGFEFALSTDKHGIERLVRRLDAAGHVHEDELLADELGDPDLYDEGARMRITVNAYERDAKLRAACIARHGPVCAVCDIDFEREYGEIGRGFIHVHHVIPASRIADVGGFDPIEHLMPVCPNCHAMLHRGRGDEPRTIHELKSLLQPA